METKWPVLNAGRGRSPIDDPWLIGIIESPKWTGTITVNDDGKELDMFRPVYQTTGAQRGQNGDCFQACIASMFGKRLNEVPNFFEGLKNGETVPKATVELMATWFHGAGCGGYVEWGFNSPLSFVLQEVNRQSPGSYFLLTGATNHGTIHTVVCRGNRIIHDPATSVGQTVLTKPCEDGYFRVGLLLMRV